MPARVARSGAGSMIASAIGGQDGERPALERSDRAESALVEAEGSTPNTRATMVARCLNRHAARGVLKTGRASVRRAVTAASVLMAVAAAVALYAIGYDTRRLAARVHALEKAAEHAEADIAAAKAELSHLSRPGRIEPLARAMGLMPPSPKQFVDESRLPRRTAGQQ